MEELTEKIADILGNPEMMDTIKGLSGLLGSSDQENTQKESSCEQEKKTEQPCSEFPSDILPLILKFAPLLASLKKEDKYTRFLQALKPLLSQSRQEKLDSSSQILKIVRILPLLKNEGLL